MLEKGFTVPALATPGLPPSPAWFPLPPGWLVLGAMLLVALTLYLFFRYARWRRNRWRRDALKSAALSHSVDGWFGLIKQVLLVHQPRAAVSQRLTPESLLASVPLESPLREALCARYCQRDNALNAEEEAQLRQRFTAWIKEQPDV